MVVFPFNEKVCETEGLGEDDWTMMTFDGGDDLIPAVARRAKDFNDVKVCAFAV